MISETLNKHTEQLELKKLRQIFLYDVSYASFSLSIEETELYQLSYSLRFLNFINLKFFLYQKLL